MFLVNSTLYLLPFHRIFQVQHWTNFLSFINIASLLLIWRGFWGINLPLPKQSAIPSRNRHKSCLILRLDGKIPQTWNPPSRDQESGRVYHLKPPQFLILNSTFIPNMQYCRCKLNLSVSSCLLFPAPRWNEATLLTMNRNLSEANERLANSTASSESTWSHSALNYFSFFYSRVNAVLSFSFHFTYILLL